MARLAALYNSGTGAYGGGGTFAEAFAILALRSGGRDVPPAAVAELKALQDADGSWSYGTAPVAVGGGDTNSTAIALMALDAAGDHSADATALAYLRTQQLPTGVSLIRTRAPSDLPRATPTPMPSSSRRSSGPARIPKVRAGWRARIRS